QLTGILMFGNNKLNETQPAGHLATRKRDGRVVASANCRDRKCCGGELLRPPALKPRNPYLSP
ncbi:MAG TPA: hypothetical protein VK554_04720, partial [Bradyrhizobium sp.]|nr:hypothetical protein [Bradyrhizobium sp.]